MIDRELLEKIIDSHFPKISDLLSKINSGELCDLITYDKSVITSCNDAYYRVLNYGLENCLNQVALEMNILYCRFVTSLEVNDIGYISTLLNSTNYVELLDVNSVFLMPTNEMFINNHLICGNFFFNYVKSFDLYDLIIYIVLMIFVFFIAFSFFLMKFKEFILKSKRMIGIIPSELITKDMDIIKSMMKETIMN